jgi:hypothetical protein
MRYLVRVDGEPGPRGGRSTTYPTQAAAALALEQELARLRACGAVIVGDPTRDCIVAYTPDGPLTILRLAPDQAP